MNDILHSNIERNINWHSRWYISLSRILECPHSFHSYYPKFSENIRNISVEPDNNIFVANCPYFKFRFTLKMTYCNWIPPTLFPLLPHHLPSKMQDWNKMSHYVNIVVYPGDDFDAWVDYDVVTEITSGFQFRMFHVSSDRILSTLGNVSEILSLQIWVELRHSEPSTH